MKQKSFNDLHNLYEGIVLLGCSDPDEWETGVIDLLEKEKIAHKNDFTEGFFITTSGGRTDVVIPFNKKNKINIGKMAIWRLKFGDCSWVSDYLVNYSNQHSH